MISKSNAIHIENMRDNLNEIRISVNSIKSNGNKSYDLDDTDLKILGQVNTKVAEIQLSITNFENLNKYV